jgi:accessory colonization factor AcfC
MLLHFKPLGRMLAASALLASMAAGPVHAQTVLNVYGPGGPAPAMQEAAKTFGATAGVSINVTAGPLPQWVDKAKADADVIFSGAENMMSDFAKALPGAFDLKEALPLYLRPVAILVRPGNPKNIRGLRDLLAPGIKVLTVAGAGQVGLWEDVAGRTGDIELVRALRRNIVFPEAVNSGAAKELWTQQADLDAWLIWNIWQVANPQLAQVVPMDERYRIYRDTGVVLTHKGKTVPQAAAFIEFLKSGQGQQIFAKWGWQAGKGGVPDVRAAAQTGVPGTLAQRFAQLDANHDGELTWEEAAPSRSRDFDAMDKNNDRRIGDAEFDGRQPFASFDIDKDGAISKAEFLATHQSMFTRVDADDNDRISLEEFAVARGPAR